MARKKIYKHEREYQADLIKDIKKFLTSTGEPCIILKNDPNYIQGVPDLSIMFRSRYALLEVKLFEDADHQPNQDYYINQVNEMGSFGAFIFPENEDEVLKNMFIYFGL